MEEIQILHLYIAAIVVAIAVAAMLWIAVHDTGSPIEWWHFVSSKGRDGKQYADLTKLGQLIGILLCIASTFIFAARKSTTASEFSILLAVVLLYLGGVQAYQSMMKSKQTETKEES
jgi:drug/metabolite transporter (DMT)-like permease